jgi:Mn-dependent DtxR family transcriptional regulator
VTDVARALEITPGSASVSLKALKQKGFVNEDHNRFLGLTEEGEKIAHDVHVANRTFIHFLHGILGVSKEQADIDSCKIEHLVSSETREKLISFLQVAMSERPEAVAFRRAVQQHTFTCPGPAVCNICGPDDTCGHENDRTETQAR